MYSQLGDIRFENAFSPTGNELTTGAKFAEHELINGKSRIQHTGTALLQMKLTLKLHRNFCVPEDEIEKLTDYTNKGQSLRYIDGNGRLIGNFVITELKESRIAQGPQGKIIEADIEVALLENYIRDVQSAAKIEAINRGFGMSPNTPALAPPTFTPVSTVAFAASEVSGLAALVARLVALFSAAQQAVQSAVETAREALEAANEAKERVENAITAVNDTVQSVQDTLIEFKENCEELRDNINTFITAVEDGDLVGAAFALADVTDGNTAVLESAETLDRIVGSRFPIPFQ